MSQENGHQVAQVVDGPVQNVPAVLHFNGLNGPGDEGKKHQVLKSMWASMWWANRTSVMAQAKMQPRFKLGRSHAARSWNEVCESMEQKQ
jgi:hypothetical protein